jgi:hypothetical protein
MDTNELPPAPADAETPQADQPATADLVQNSKIRKLIAGSVLGLVNVGALLAAAFLILFVMAEAAHPNPAGILIVGVLPMTGIAVASACVLDAIFLIAYLFSHKNKSRGRIITAAVALTLVLAILGLVVGYFVWAADQARAGEKSQNRVMGKDEFMSLVNGCGVRSFYLDSDGKVHITYSYSRAERVEKGDPATFPFTADGAYYDDYVKVADAAGTTCGAIEYFKSDQSAATSTDNCTGTLSDGPWTFARRQIVTNISRVSRTVSYRDPETGTTGKIPYCFVDYVDKNLAIQVNPDLSPGATMDLYWDKMSVYLVDSAAGDTRPKTGTAAVTSTLPKSANECVSGHPVAVLKNVRVTGLDEANKSVTYKGQSGTTKTIGWCGEASVAMKQQGVPYPMLTSTFTAEIDTQDGFAYMINMTP